MKNNNMIINSNKNKSHHPLLPHFLNPMHKSCCHCNSGKSLEGCGCCELLKTLTPMNVENPPSLSSIKYRIGTHGIFKAAMLTNISRKPVLSRLTTREDNDLAIAIIDGWATVADIITFYQERIANEGFLRTSTERMSLLELARSVGYELGSGVASDTLLAFMVEENNPSIEKTIIQVGTKVQSIPHQGEIPQTFETIEMIEARPELNEMKSNTVVPHTIDRNTTTLYFEGMDTKLRQDDMLLVVDKGSEQIPKFFAKVLDVKTIEKKNVTIAKIMIIWSPESKSLKDVNTDMLSTHNADSTKNNTSRNEMSSFSDYKKENFSSSDVDMATKTKENTSSSPMTVREMNSSELTSMAVRMNVSEKELIEDQDQAAEQNMKSIAPDVYAFRQKAAIFGHDAPNSKAFDLNGSNLCDWDDNDVHIFRKVNIKNTVGPCFEDYYLPDEPNIDKPQIVFLDNVYENIIGKNGNKKDSSNSWVVFCSTNLPTSNTEDVMISVLPSQVERTLEETLAEFTVTGKATGIQLKKLTPKQKTTLKEFRRRKTTVYIESEKLELAGKINETPVMGDFIELEKAVYGLKKDQVVIITGEKLDATGKPEGKIATEDRKLREIEKTAKKIFFDRQLDHTYLRESVKIYANVARATHGETKREVLGSGNPTISQQSFTLKQKPLTYIKTPTSTGAASTLEVRVNDILWKEVDYLYYDLSPKDQVFVTRKEDDGSTIITFGDGKRGSKPFIGVENITAKYRIGTGKEGRLGQNQLSLLTDRPLGVKSVRNPFPTSATAEDPEKLESARINAPAKVLTMNRIVTIYDFENFVRSFLGIGKVKVSELWNGTKMIVHLSISSSSSSDQRLDPLSCENIARSITRFKDPSISFMLDSFIPKTFSLAAKIKVTDDMSPDKVLESVKNVIMDTYSFEKRQFAQSVKLSEVLTLIQNVHGVVFVDLDEFYLDKPVNNTGLKKSQIHQKKLETFLPCLPAYYDNKKKKIITTEILIVNPQGVRLLAVD